MERVEVAEHSWDRPGSQVVRWAFVLSLAADIYFVLALVALDLRAWLPDWFADVALVSLAYLLAHLAIRAIRRRHPRFLESPKGLTTREGLAAIIVWSVPIYAVLVVIVGGLAYVLVPREDHHWPFMVYGLAVWGSAWLCVAPATLVSWWRTR